MALLPAANVTINDQAGAFAGGTGYLVVMGCAARNPDLTPRVFSSAAAMLSQHDYSQAVGYSAIHFQDAKTPVIYVGLPIVTAGTIGRQNNSGVTGSSVISVTAGSAGVLEETVGSITVVNGGTIGVDGITFNLSLDGGSTQKLVRLNTASSYTPPYVGIVLNFAAGTLVAGDVYTFATTAPLWDNAGLTAAWAALAAQLNLARSALTIGDIANSTFAGYVTTQVNAYATAQERFTLARVNVRDRLNLAAKSRIQKTAQFGAATLTFASGGETVTRSSGSYITDGFAVGDVVTFAGSASNNVSVKITTLTATVLTASGASFVNEGPTGGITMTGSEGLVFASSGETITRSVGNWLNDGFAVGDSVTITGTASNNTTQTITVLTSTVMTFAAGLANETIGSYSVTMTKGETLSAHVSAMATAFSSVDAQNRIDLGLGRLRKVCPITGWNFRRPVAWAASVREYQHDIQIPTWRKADGPLDGWSLLDANNVVVEYDERSVGGALAARFTCARTYGNGPKGSFIALSLTRATEGSLLSRTHNMFVANLACTVTQIETENAIGQVLQLNSNGTGTTDSLTKIEERVNTALGIALLQQGLDGPRASSAVWRASRTDVLNVPGATLTGVTDLRINGTLEQINTSVLIRTAG